MNKPHHDTSPFDDPAPPLKEAASIPAPGPGQFSLRVLALITFDVAFVLGWWANANTHSQLGEDMGEFANRVIGSTLRIGVIAFPVWTGVLAFLPALLGAAIGSSAHPNVEYRRKVRGASLFWTLISAMLVEWLIQWGLLIANFDSDAKLLFFAFGNLGWSGLALIIYLFWVAAIGAGYGFVVALALSLLGRWKMIPLRSPWSDAPWTAMGAVGLYGPYIWLNCFLVWQLAGKPELLTM